jgi:ABC-type multidrug transport system permease subunit
MAARMREFYREPQTLFWVYGFPLLMTIGLGIAFRNKPVERITVDVQGSPTSPAVQEAVAALGKNEKFVARVSDAEASLLRLRTNRTELVVVPSPSVEAGYEYWYDPTRAESLLARNAVDDALQRAKGRVDRFHALEHEYQEPGGRYIDFLVPGLLGMNLMGGGLWGVGFVIVEMRIRKLLKRFIATPMKRSHFLAAILLSRLVFMVPDVLILLGFAWLVFGVVIQGSLLAVMIYVLLGAFTFAGIGLLVASRAKTLETVSGLMNLVMLPMWLLSGIFFSSERFPDAVQPLIKALPLTPLIDGLRAVMLEGESLAAQLPRLGILAAWGLVTFVLALRWFRWT